MLQSKLITEIGVSMCRGYTPQYDPTRSVTRLELGDSLVTRLDRAVYDSLETRRAGQMGDKAQGPVGRFM